MQVQVHVHAHAQMSRCVFIIATPGSGSSTMRAAVENRTGCLMSGENWGALLSLSDMHARIEMTQSMGRQSQHDYDAWRMVFKPHAVVAEEHRLVQALLNPDGRPCWGFKEVRYGRDQSRPDTFARDLKYLAGLCQQPRFVLHSRRTIARELESEIIQLGGAGAVLETQAQWRCFDAYCASPQAAANFSSSERCIRSPGVAAVPVFRHTLLLGRPAREQPAPRAAVALSVVGHVVSSRE